MVRFNVRLMRARGGGGRRKANGDTAAAARAPVARHDSGGHDTVSCSASEADLISEEELRRELNHWKKKNVELMSLVSTQTELLARRSAKVEMMRAAEEREEKKHHERMLMLEMQLVRLVEMREGVDKSNATSAACTLLKEVDCDALQYAKLEISALEELLSRILAERDELEFRYKRLDSFIKGVALTQRADDSLVAEGGNKIRLPAVLQKVPLPIQHRMLHTSRIERQAARAVRSGVGSDPGGRKWWRQWRPSGPGGAFLRSHRVCKSYRRSLPWCKVGG